MALKVYYDNDTNMCHVGGDDYRPDNVRLSGSDDSVILEFGKTRLIDRLPVSQLVDKQGTPYPDFETFRTSIKNFFVNAPVAGAKWKTYKALISRFGEDDPIERVLNQDEDDCLKLNNLHYSVADACIVGEIDIPEDEYIFIPKSYSIPDDADALVDVKIVINGGVVQIFYSYNNGGGEITDLARVLIEFSIKIRGTAPVLLSAETNIAGDKIILTFDKKMSGYGLSTTNMGYSYNGDVGHGASQINKISDNVLEISGLEDLLISTDIISFSYIVDSIESFDYGILEEIHDFSVTNNVL